MKNSKLLLYVFVLLSILFYIQSAPLYAASMGDYCSMPPYVTTGIQPNLLIMLDNSASQFDLEYQDTANTYCANAQTTSCTPGTTCSGTAYCLSSATTTTTTTCSAKACTDDSQCPHSTITYKAKPCSGKSDCPNSNSCSGNPKACSDCDTSTGVGDCVVATHPCNAGFCTNCTTGGSTCNTTTQDCVSTSDTTYTPIACTTDATCSAITAGDTCNNKCNATRQCYDTTYTTTTNYYGYFDSTATYSYDLTNDKFTSGATMPSSCTYSAGTPRYVCVNTSGTPEAIDGFVASGNFLNWLTASKFDIQKKILTGGKFDATNNVLLAESRGCAGRKFIKAVPGVNLTFAVRGGTPGGIGSTQSLATEYGQTYIEIYTGTYNITDCLNAMYDWMNYDSVNLGSFQNDTKGCVGAGNSQYNAVNVWNHILHDCYDGMNNKAQGYSTNLGPLEGECQKAYDAGVARETINDPNSGIAICSSVLSGPGGPGYLGTCWNGTSLSFNSPCDVTQMQNYCIANVNTNPVIDPSSTVLPGSGSSAPGFIMEQGLMNTNLVGTLTVKAGLTPAPTGLVDKYKNLVRFGAMTFRNNGSASESGTGKIPVAKACSVTQTRMCFVDGDCPAGEACGTLSDKDGGKIISYIGVGKCSATGTDCIVNGDCLLPGETCNLWVGDHTSGLINQIDSVVASTWTPFAEAFYNVIGYYTQNTGMRINSTASKDFETNVENSAEPNPIQYKCQQNNVLLITDGMSTADQNSTEMTFVSSNNNGGQITPVATATLTTPPTYFGSKNLDDLSWYGQTASLSNPGITGNIGPIATFVVYTGVACPSKDAHGNCTTTDESVPEKLMQLTAGYGGGTYQRAGNPDQLTTALTAALEDVIKRASAGAAASVLASGEGSGANLIQAVFYPKKRFINSSTGVYDTVGWIGRLSNLWYYVDPFFNTSSIYEDNANTDILNLTNDNQVTLYYNPDTQLTMAKRYVDTNGDGVADTQLTPDIEFEKLKVLWEAGTELWKRTTARTIKTSIGGSLIDFSVSNRSTLRDYLQAATDNEAEASIRYALGEDNPVVSGTTYSYRARTVAVDLNGDGDTLDAGESAKVWKLGDILNSTPKISSWIPLNNYYTVYKDTSYDNFTKSSTYTGRGMVFAGGNDGMLHAFKLGKLELPGRTGNNCTFANYEKACLYNTDASTPLGHEMWAFIPKNALPYLKYMTDPGYCHIFTIDLSPYVFDASIGAPGSVPVDISDVAKPNDGSTWRTILIGGMRDGGACRDQTGACNSTTDGLPDCVKTPVTGKGYSSYFALDITDQNNPTLLWEFSNGGLGFTTTGPSVVRIGDQGKNGKWFVVLGSGPTGPIDTTYKQFMGRSDQNLSLFILDLKTGALLRTIDTGISNAFAGSMLNSTLDADVNYQDDLVYIGYVKKCTSSFSSICTNGTWTDGGVLRLQTKEDATDVTASNWEASQVIDGIGPVTSAVTKLVNKNKGNLWIFFGAGRYYFEKLTEVDDQSTTRTLFGLKDPCYTSTGLDRTCTTLVSSGDLTNVTSIGSVPTETTANSASFKGWYIGLDASSPPSYTYCEGGNGSCPPGTCTGSCVTRDYRAERVITDPLGTTSGLVFFTTFKPYNDVCAYGGKSFLWSVKYSTGGAPGALLKGVALLQVSTGSIEQINLSTAFTEAGGRKTSALEGVPPTAQGLSLMTTPPPVKRTIHIRER